MPGTGLNVWEGGGMVCWVVCKPTLVFSLVQAEQLNAFSLGQTKLNLTK